MARYTDPKNRVARKFGVNIFGRKRNPLLHKTNPPGVHGAKRRKKSDYGLQLEEKQKLKAVYGMLSEKQLVKYYREASKHKGGTVSYLVRFCECRLDNIVYKMKFAPTIFGAQQLVAHGHILVNGKKVDIRSFQVKPGMTVSIKEKSRKMKLINESLANAAIVPGEYLSLDEKSFSGELLTYPEADQITMPLEINISEICDFLAHTT
jgi:small subunit ribosomal protein S4